MSAAVPSPSSLLLRAALGLLVLLYVFWFRADQVAVAVFALPPLLLLIGVILRWRTAPFWAGVLALAWFSHGVMVAWSRPPERWQALAEVALATVVVIAASLPGLRARFAGKRA